MSNLAPRRYVCNSGLVGPWTRTLDLNWRTKFEFYDKRASILHQAREQSLLKAYTWGVNDISLRLGQFDALRCRAGDAEIFALSPNSSLDNIRAAAGLFLDAIEPTSVSVTSACFTFMAPLDLDAQEAQRLFTEGIAGEFLPDARPIDGALLVDGRSGQFNGDFQVEYGVIGRGEVEVRLSGEAGRIGIEGGPIVPDSSDAPECSFFLGWVWTFDEPALHEGLNEAWDYWNDLANESERISGRILDRYGFARLGQGLEQA